MNNQRRKMVDGVKNNLYQIIDKIADIRDEEDECRDSMPENLQDTERYTISENCSEAMDDAIGSIQDAIDTLDNMEG